MRRRGPLRRSAGLGAVGLARVVGRTAGDGDPAFEEGIGDPEAGAASGSEVDPSARIGSR